MVTEQVFHLFINLQIPYINPKNTGGPNHVFSNHYFHSTCNRSLKIPHRRQKQRFLGMMESKGKKRKREDLNPPALNVFTTE